jgi:hypothetical protein
MGPSPGPMGPSLGPRGAPSPRVEAEAEAAAALWRPPKAADPAAFRAL